MNIATIRSSARSTRWGIVKLRRSLLAVVLALGLAAVGEVSSSTVVLAEADANLVPLVPARLLETRVGQDLETIDHLHEGVGQVMARTSYRLDVAGRGGVDVNADAVMLNVTAVAPESLGFLTVYPCTAKVPKASNVNYFAGDVAPNSALAKLSDSGEVCIYSLATTDVIVDVLGYVPVGGAPVPVEPARLVETRQTPTDVTVDHQYEGLGRLGPGKTIEFDATGRGGVPDGADAVYLNVTAINPDGAGFLTVYPCGTSRPDVSNVNYLKGDVTPNAVLTSVGTNGQVCIYTLASADIIADVNGYMPPGGNRVSISPARCADTRIPPDGQTFDHKFEGDGRIKAGDIYQVDIAGRCNVSDTASAVYLNVTAVNPSAPGFLTVWPCDEPRPDTSNVNYGPGEVQPNAVLSKVTLDTKGSICIFSLAETDVIVDVNGYVPEPGLYGVVDIGVGQYHACGAHSDGTVTCWGQNSSGELGLGVESNYEPPRSIEGFDGIVEIEGGQYYTCALSDDGSVWCWGYNNHGQLGDGTTTERHVPTEVLGVSGAERIAVGSAHACAILGTSSVKCWGRNNQGQLGDGTKTDSPTPVTVAFGAAVEPIDIDAARDNTCVVLADGTARCWGGGTLGDGSSAQSSVPVTVSGLAGATQIATAAQSTCARLGNGTVQCWGVKNRLGNGDTIDVQLTPVAVVDLAGVSSVTAGTSTNCVAFAAGGAACWGGNTIGETGNGNNDSPQLTPVDVVGISDKIVEIISGDGLYGHATCALLEDTSTYCWGLNGHSQLGVPRTLQSSWVPVGVGTTPGG